MVRAQNIATTCGQKEIIVTYDLAIAKMAYQIQLTDTPKYDNLFINLGAFHIQIALFKAIGKYIDMCGITEILVESGMLAEGSVNGFINSKHFNRCKRMHPLTSGALQVLLIEAFLSENDIDSFLIIDDLKQIQNNPVDCKERIRMSPIMEDILSKYQNFFEENLNGTRGKTAQFYSQYIEYVNVYLRFTRSIKTSDYELYIISLYEIASLFFIFNQPNYARWILHYLCNMINLKIQNSKLIDEFKKGAFGIKRSNNALARAPVDLTLEQTINANASSKLTGITHFTNSISARQRWAISHSMKARVISKILEN